MGYREEYFKHNPGVAMPFKRERYYMCCRCHKWFPKSQIDVDHIIPQNKNGSDALYNLQAMCRHCNRSKQDNQSGFDTAKAVFGAAMHGDLGTLMKGSLVYEAEKALGIKKKRKKRK